MDLGLQGKVVLVTGASRGLGLAMARSFAKEGARLALCARHAGPLAARAGELRAAGAEVLAVTADVTVPADRERLVQQARQAVGPINVLINNVGGGGADTFVNTTPQQWTAALDLTLHSALGLTTLVVPDMVARRRGCVLFISSIYGREWGGRPAYMVAKAAQIAAAKSLARELAPAGVRVNSIAPGSILFAGGSWDRRRQADPVAIEGFVRQELPSGRFGRPEEIADVVVFVASERASLLSGACINVDGAQSRSLL